jgi:hypothetical protein
MAISFPAMAGRPFEGPKRSFRLSDEDFDFAREIANGDATDGIRLALDEARERRGLSRLKRTQKRSARSEPTVEDVRAAISKLPAVVARERVAIHPQPKKTAKVTKRRRKLS